MSPLARLLPSYPNVFSLQFFTAAGGTGAPATRTDSKASGILATGPARGDPFPENRSVRYGAQGTKTTTDHRTSITSLPRSHTPTITITHLASHHQQPSFRCLTTHTRSWGWVVKHPPQPAISPVAGPTPCIKGQKRVWDRGPGPRKPDIHNTSKHDSPATPPRTRSHPPQTQLHRS
jgi:hypothetical protein